LTAGLRIYCTWKFSPKPAVFGCLTNASSSANCARELFKPAKASASLQVCTRKTLFGWGLQNFCEWRHTDLYKYNTYS